MNKTENRSPVKGLKRLVMWLLTADTEDTAPAYGEAHAFSKSLMTASYTPNVAESVLDADDQQVEVITETNGGELTIGVTALTTEEENIIYGHTIQNGVIVENINDMGSYVGVAYMTPRTDGKVNLYKYAKVRFSKQAESYNTKKAGGTEFGTVNLKGSSIPLINNENSRYVKKAVDPKEAAEFIQSWFSDGNFIGDAAEETASQTSNTNTEADNGAAG